MQGPSPYAPPTSRLDPSPYATPPQPPPRRTRIDIGEALGFTFKDPQWMSKVLTAGVIMLVPLVGVFVVLGWQVNIYHRVLQGDNSLPSPDFGADLGRGWKHFLAMFTGMLPLVALILALMMLIFGTGAALAAVVNGITDSSEGGAVIMMLTQLCFFAVNMVFSLGINLLLPELFRRGTTGELFMLFRPRESLQRARGNWGALATAGIGTMIANMLGGIGVFACYVGMLLTLPMAYAASAHLAAQWTSLTEPDLG
jgi:hypothetical protein